MLMTMYKGPIMEMGWTKHADPHQGNVPAAAADGTDKDWLKGCVFLIIATLAWASLFILQLSTVLSSACRVVGAVLIVVGLYFVLWGKHKEKKLEAATDIPVAVKETTKQDEDALEMAKANKEEP
ncbi:hypothetical protein BHM03_00018753 [Ensete ventricosum]|nr:hypothetical protein BHM03_00018753 [Ensete ventricosum]